MKHALIQLSVLGVIACSTIGCGSGDTKVTVEPKEVPAKALLESVASSGELGSGAIEIRDALESMKASGDTAKADELLAELEELQKMSNPDQIKKKAASMASKL